MKNILLLAFCCGFLPLWASADTLPPASDCCVIVTNYGKVIPARIADKKDGYLRFYECNDTANALNIMPMDQVWRIKPLSYLEKVRPLSDTERALRNDRQSATTLTIGGGLCALGAWAVAIYASAFLALADGILVAVGIAFVLAILGLCLGYLLLRKTRNKPHLRRFKKAAQAIVVVSGLLTGIVLLLTVLALAGLFTLEDP